MENSSLTALAVLPVLVAGESSKAQSGIDTRIVSEPLAGWQGQVCLPLK